MSLRQYVDASVTYACRQIWACRQTWTAQESNAHADWRSPSVERLTWQLHLLHHLELIRSLFRRLTSHSSSLTLEVIRLHWWVRYFSRLETLKTSRSYAVVRNFDNTNESVLLWSSTDFCLFSRTFVTSLISIDRHKYLIDFRHLLYRIKLSNMKIYPSASSCLTIFSFFNCEVVSWNWITCTGQYFVCGECILRSSYQWATLISSRLQNLKSMTTLLRIILSPRY